MDRRGLFFHHFYINSAGKRSGVDSKCAICIWKQLLWTHIMQSKYLSIQYMWNRQLLGFKNKTIHQRDSRNIRSCQINSLVHSEKNRTHWWTQQHKKAWTSTEDNSGGWSENWSDSVNRTKAFFGRLKLRSTCTRMTGRKKYREGLEQLMIQNIQHHLWNTVERCDGMSVHGFHDTGLLVFSDDMTEDRNSRMNSEVYRDILSAQIQSNAAKLIGRHLGQWPKTYIKSNPGVFESKKVEYSGTISWSQPDWACISLAQDKTKSRKTHKQTITEVSCSKGLAKHHKRGNPVSGDVHEFQT